MRRLLPIALMLLVGCSDIFSPSRADVYDFRAYRSQGSSVDTLTFHWSRDLLPVRIYVADDDPLRPYAAIAISRWSGAFLYGEFRGVLVSDSTKADVVLRNAFPPGGPALHALRVDAFAPQCSGETDLDVPGGTNLLALPINSYIWANNDPNAAGIETCYSITVTHEIGHALGLINRSHAGTTIGDVMFANPALDGLSDRDRQTIETAYHTAATLTVTGRR
jgi:hypothetical protein